ncbi:DNRLRE domain-containing protein [Streptomyces chitinivorans]|uniref:DNRLRE domain-containing protein n=1 Tax=Streptomyces chitinivorans TaxID=1257027 RepID=A0ABW7HVW4_9ACTN|nr:DNRLRE domain-containing protein [Streptomyces chitinivorans]MDH2407374.1 DNRLRE domain-containing protein [Streptomyces chitinivorans]
MTAPRLVSPFVRTRTRLACTLGLLLAALTAALLPWWQWPPGDGGRPSGGRAAEAGKARAEPRDEAAAAAEARRRGKPVPVDTATTATSLTWALPEGGLRTRIHALPQRARNGEGRWAAIDTELERTDDAPGALGIRPANAPLPVRFSNGGARGAPGGARGGEDRSGRSYTRLPVTLRSDGSPAGESVLAEVEIDGHTIAYTWPGPLPEPVLDGPRALYPEVLPGVDLLLVAREEGGFGQLLIVKDREAAQQKALEAPAYGLRSKTAVFRHDETTGGVRALDEDGEEITSIPTPFAWDSSGQDPEASEARPRTSTATTADVLELSGLSGAEPGSRQAPMPTRLDGDGTGSARLHLDAAATGLLTDGEARFPLFLDPTLNSGWKAWTTAYKPYPNTSFYNGTNFNSGTSDARVGHEDDTNGTARSFWRMGYSSSLKGATVTSAKFKVLNNHSWSCTKRQFELYLTGAISSGTTWNKQPSWSTLQDKLSFAHGWSSSCADEYVSFDVKNAAQKGADGGWSSITLGMRATSESDTQTWRKFRATSATLEVVYNRKPNEPKYGKTSPGGDCVPGPGGGRTVGKTNLVLSATATDPDGNLKGLRFRFWKTGGTVPTGTLVTSLSSGKGSITIPSTSLEDKTTYSWDVRAEDSSGAVSTYFPPGTDPCRITVDGEAPPAPEVSSDVFPEATSDGATWATVKFGETGPITFSSPGAVRFTYAFEGLNAKEAKATSGTATVPDLKPPHSGPTYLHVYAYDAYGNRSERTNHPFYVPPRDAADGPGDTGGDGMPDLLIIDANGNLRTLPSDVGGELYGSLASSYTTGGKLNPSGHWYDPDAPDGMTAALITKHSDAYPGDGVTDLFARTPDGGFWLYPGDGYGSFNVDKRLRVLLPSNAPDPATWTQIKAVGDVTGDKLPDLFLRAGTAFWALTGYTGASFQEATLMNGNAWARRDVVNVADVDLDGTPDLLWRNLDNGNMYVRHGKPGTGPDSVDLHSLKLAVNSRDGDVRYGTNWSDTDIPVVVGIPDVNGDRIPDMWAVYGSDGKTRIYHPSKTNTNAAVKMVLSVDWRNIKSFG